jgi:UDP-3-O-[3-hydroxymyristoyl] N-acetylglucosamine deacetylase
VIRLEGVALHAGTPAAVTLTRAGGPVTFAQRGAEVPIEDLRVVRADQGVRVEGGGVAIDLVEHLLAALGGLGVREGVRVEVEGDEVPLLDGGAARFVEALRAIEAPAGPPRLVVTRAASLELRGSRYRFHPADTVRVAVEVDFPPPVGAASASWDGDADDFAAHVAPARTFGWAKDHAALLAAGRARAVDLDAVLVFGDAGPIDGCRATTADEPARHKLLDLVGDLALHGGPPRGAVHAERPGHAATHRIVALALEAGVLRRTAD